MLKPADLNLLIRLGDVSQGDEQLGQLLLVHGPVLVRVAHIEDELSRNSGKLILLTLSLSTIATIAGPHHHNHVTRPHRR